MRLTNTQTQGHFSEKITTTMKKTMSENIKVPLRGKKLFSLHRRDFLKYLGGGIIIIFNPFQGCKPKLTPATEERSLPKDFNSFLHICEDGAVSCYTGKIEMGQGSIDPCHDDG